MGLRRKRGKARCACLPPALKASAVNVESTQSTRVDSSRSRVGVDSRVNERPVNVRTYVDANSGADDCRSERGTESAVDIDPNTRAVDRCAECRAVDCGTECRAVDRRPFAYSDVSAQSSAVECADAA